MDASETLVQVLAGAGGGLFAGLGLGWWYFRRGAAHGSTGADDGDPGEEPASQFTEVARVEQRLAEPRRAQPRAHHSTER